MAARAVSLELLIWSQTLLLWSIAIYGVMADPLSGERAHVRRRWIFFLLFRAILAAAVEYALSRSMVLSISVLLALLLQPLLRSLVPMRLLAEFEGFWIAAFLTGGLGMIRHFHMSTRFVPDPISPAHLAALCILASALIVVVRGGTYIVRGILTMSGSLPPERRPDDVPRQSESPLQMLTINSADSVHSIAASVEQPALPTIDVEEYNRGRLIGNLERIVLTIVIAAGSYAALAFLIAAKGLVRSDEFNKNRDFTEYFLIGSLSSVLVALCAGMALRFALIRLWPDLLNLQIQ
jgi:hypothetical protein